MGHKTLHPKDVRLVYRCRNCGEEQIFSMHKCDDPPKGWSPKDYIKHIAHGYLNKYGMGYHLHQCDQDNEGSMGIMEMVRVYLEQPNEQSISEDVLNNTPVWP